MKEVKDALIMAVREVKEYVESIKFKARNNSYEIKLRTYQIIKQKKFVYDTKTVQNFLSDSLARVTNSFGDFNNKDMMSRVVTIHMDIHDSYPKTLKKIYFSQKGKVPNQGEIIKDVLDYCYKGKRKFISKQIHELIFLYWDNFKLTNGLEMESNYLTNCGEFDDEILEYLFNDLASIKGVENLKDLKKLHYLIIIVIDFLILKESLPKFFVIDSEFSVEEVEKNQMDVHPDVKLGLKIKSLQSSNKYIGSSHLCCCTCSLLLDSLGLNFRGTNRKFETKWSLPSNLDLNDNTLLKFVQNLNSLNAKISKEKLKNIENIIKEKIGDKTYEIINLKEFEIQYNESRDEDTNKNVSGIISDDTSHYIEYLSTVSQKNLDKLKNLVQYLADKEDE